MDDLEPCPFWLQEELTPIRNAIDSMEDVNSKMKQMIGQYQADSSLPINPLSLQLNGVIDSAVMGGPPKYEEVMPTELEKLAADSLLLDLTD